MWEKRKKEGNSPATSSWTSLPGNSHQWSLGWHGWMTGKEVVRGEAFPKFPQPLPTRRFSAPWPRNCRDTEGEDRAGRREGQTQSHH